MPHLIFDNLPVQHSADTNKLGYVSSSIKLGIDTMVEYDIPVCLTSFCWFYHLFMLTYMSILIRLSKATENFTLEGLAEN
jgi:hypothetical protein